MGDVVMCEECREASMGGTLHKPSCPTLPHDQPPTLSAYYVPTELVLWMKRHGVLHAKWDAEGHLLEAVIGPAHLPPPPVQKIDLTTPKGRKITDAELLYAATEGLPED